MPYHTVTDSTEFTSLLYTLYNSSKYKYIYISIGGKYNEENVNIPRLGKPDKHLKTNAELQLCPNFLFERNSQILLICFDSFQNSESSTSNQQIIESRIQPNMDFIFYDERFTVNSICEKISSTIEIFDSLGIDADNVMICNFIRFLNEPSMNEVSFELELPSMIYKSVVDTRYKKSYYMWFGYQPLFYNLLYRYDDYHIRYLMDYHMILKIGNFIDTSIGIYDVQEIYDLSPKYIPKKIIDCFLSSIVDINSYMSCNMIGNI
jgi:hypothetical protein